MADEKRDIVAEAREKAGDISVFAEKYRRDPDNYLTTHAALDEDQAEADLWNALVDEVERLREENIATENLEVLVYRHGPVTIEKRVDDRWAVCWAGMVLNHDADWEYEPLPSNRSENFVLRTRYSTPQAAYRH